MFYLIQLKLIFDEDLEKYFHKIGELNKFNSNVSERLRNKFKEMNENMIKVMYNLDDIAKDTDLLYKLNKKVNAVSFIIILEK